MASWAVMFLAARAVNLCIYSISFPEGKAYHFLSVLIPWLWVIEKYLATFPLLLCFYPSHFWPLGVVVACVYVSVCMCVFVCVFVCVCIWITSYPHNSLSPVLGGITKFGPQVQNTLLKITIVVWVDWSWPSWSNFQKRVCVVLQRLITHF